MRTTVKTKSHCSQNKFVCHPEQKQMYCQNNSEQGSEQVVIIARTTYYSRENEFTSHLEQ
jgi:hypothetical protein